MSSFEPRAAGSIVARPDPAKHVNYNLGMVLGVDDFTQEFAYVVGRDQWMARDLLGYGTACGLRVTIENEGAGGPQVVVTPGAAVSPRGQLIRVKPTQCADLNDWLKLDKNKPTLDAITDSDRPLILYVVLCYRECRTDQVPIPGEPCRSEDESMAASRVADDFSLELRFDAPDQREEDALRDFVAWLGQIETDTSGDLYTQLEQFEEAIREAAHLLTSPPASPLDYMYGSPPASLRIPANAACEYLRAALRIWVTELRPIWLAQGETASGQLPNEECVLLAELSVPIVKAGTEWAVDDSRVAKVDEERRPFLIHLRMLQEWIECGRRERDPADFVRPEQLFGQIPDAGRSLAYSRADHTHGTPMMLGDVTVDWDNRTLVGGLSNIPLVINTAGEDALEDGQVLTYVSTTDDGGGQGQSSGGSTKDSADGAGGDDTGSTPPEKQSIDAPAATIKDLRDTTPDARPTGPGTWRPSYLKIQGMPVSHDKNQLVLPNQVLTFVGGDELGTGIWQAMDPRPSNVANMDGDVTGPSYANTVSKIQNVAVHYDDRPRDGQVLTFVEAEDGSEMRLEPRDVTTSGGGTLDGDVTGRANATSVVKIRGVDVAPAAPTLNQVLTFTGREWTPRTLSSGGGSSPTPSNTVEPETEFGHLPDAGRSVAYSRADHTHGTPIMGGDVSGTSSTVTVMGIQNISVASRKPRENQVLVFRDDHWQPADLTADSVLTEETRYGQPPWAGGSPGFARADHTHGTPPLPSLKGDVKGEIDSILVQGIMGMPIEVLDLEELKDGAVLTFRRVVHREFWTVELPGQGSSDDQPDKAVSRTAPDEASTMAVQHPDVGPYSIVAAGIVKGDGSVRGGTGYNGLKATVTGPGRLTASFNGYENPETDPPPDRPFFYIVKALPVINPDAQAQPKMLSVFFEKYQQGSLVLRVTDQGEFVDQNTLSEMEFMLEISRYETQDQADTERMGGVSK